MFQYRHIDYSVNLDGRPGDGDFFQGARIGQLDLDVLVAPVDELAARLFDGPDAGFVENLPGVPSQNRQVAYKGFCSLVRDYPHERLDDLYVGHEAAAGWLCAAQ